MPAPRLGALEVLSATLLERGGATWDAPLPLATARTIRDEVLGLKEQDAFRPALVGRGERRRRRPEVRSDSVCWLRPIGIDEEDRLVGRPGLRALWALLDEIRAHLIERAFVSLNTIELHAAHYPAGAFYKPHLDRFVGSTERHFTVVCYLNEGWTPDDGGLPSVLKPLQEELAPLLGRLVVFHTPEVLHEVTRAHHDRFAVAGWLGRSRWDAL